MVRKKLRLVEHSCFASTVCKSYKIQSTAPSWWSEPSCLLWKIPLLVLSWMLNEQHGCPVGTTPSKMCHLFIAVKGYRWVHRNRHTTFVICRTCSSWQALFLCAESGRQPWQAVFRPQFRVARNDWHWRLEFQPASRRPTFASLS